MEIISTKKDLGTRILAAAIGYGKMPYARFWRTLKAKKRGKAQGEAFKTENFLIYAKKGVIGYKFDPSTLRCYINRFWRVFEAEKGGERTG